MTRRMPRKRKISREQRQRRDAAVMGCGVLLVAAIFILTMMARVELTALSDEAAGLQSELEELRVSERLLSTQYEQAFSLDKISERAEAIGMTSPSELGAQFIEPMGEDITIVYD